MGSFVTLELEEVEHKRHSCRLSTEQIWVKNRADVNSSPYVCHLHQNLHQHHYEKHHHHNNRFTATKNNIFPFSCPSTSIPTYMGQTDSPCYHSERSPRQRTYSLIISNFCTQASWRLYEIRKPPNSLFTTSNLCTNTVYGTFHLE